MYLKNFIKNLNKRYNKINFSGLAFNSKHVKKNYIFFAIEGNKIDGNNYISDSIKNGANVIISNRYIKSDNKEVVFIKHKNPRKLLSEISYKLINKRPKNLIAVTGTNGKSSVADFYFQILKINKKKAASIGTIGIQSDQKRNFSENTTLDPIRLREVLNNLGSKNISNIILEASSHGLKQKRLDGLFFDIGIFTNLSHDHLDYHKNLNDYFNSKLYLFKNLIKKKGIIIADPTISYFDRIKKIAIQRNLKLLTIFKKNSDLALMSHHYENDYQCIVIKFKNKIHRIKLNLIGKIQVKNVLMATLAAINSGININLITKNINKLKPAEGRLEKVGILRDNSKVILDYAHSPDALSAVLKNTKEQFPNAKINLLFGCGGDRDKAKRLKMGRIASKFADKIYLTDDNPRSENPQSIRNDIRKGIKNRNFKEIPNRKIAIFSCINDLSSGDIAIIAGKGHEKKQEYKGKKYFFSDRKEIIKSIKVKNIRLFDDKRLNIIQEKTRPLNKNIKFNNASINSREVRLNDIFFAIKGKKDDGNKYLKDAIKNRSSIVVTNKIDQKIRLTKQLKVKNTLKFLTECASKYRNNINTNIIGITGSCGKTTLKELLGYSMSKISKIYFSPKSYNNKYGVPLSLFNLKQNKKFGIFEIGMDKKGEINFLSNLLKPNIGIITNISYAHSKNFKNIKGIAEAKSELIDNIRERGKIILNEDDNFFNFLKKKAIKKNLEIFSFSLRNKKSYVNLVNIIKVGNNFKVFFKVGTKKVFFYSKNNSKNHIQNLLAAITTLSLFYDINKISKNIVLNFKFPEGRGDISKLQFKNKSINFIDESYNSNPLSLKTALSNFSELNLKNNLKHVLLGDMLELGKDSLYHHKSLSTVINKLNIDKVHVFGKYIKETYLGLKKDKQGLILTNLIQINNLINNILNNNDYLMVKGSNSTGLNKKFKILKLNK